MVKDELPSWTEWQALKPEERAYHKYLWMAGVNARLDNLEQSRVKSKLLVFWGSLTGSVITIGGLVLAKIKLF